MPITVSAVPGWKKKNKPNQREIAGPKKYSKGMSYQDMMPYGGKFVKIKKEMRDKATKNVKQLTTSDAAYSPERRYAVLSQKTPSGGKRITKPVTDWDNKKDVIKGMKDKLAGAQYGKGNWRAQVLTPSEAEEQGIIRRKRSSMHGDRGKGTGTRKIQRPRKYVKDKPKNVLGRNKGGMGDKRTFSHGGEARVRGMGAAIKGGKFEGVF